jgi:transposase
MGNPGTPTAAPTPGDRPAQQRPPPGDRGDGVLARTGAPWRDLPSQYGSWKTVASRFYRWRQQGIFEWLLAEVHRRADACGELDWLCHYVDGSVVRAHQHAAGPRHQPSQEDRERGSSTRKMRHWGPAAAGEHQAAPAHRRGRPPPGDRGHARPAPRGHPAAGAAGRRAVKRTGPDGRPGRGRPRQRPAKLAGDKGYSYPSARWLLRRRGIRSMIPTRSDQPRQATFDRAAYRGRNRVERSVGRLILQPVRPVIRR